MSGQTTSSHSDRALANYHDIIDGQLESVVALEAWLKDRSAFDKTCEDIASSIYPLLSANKSKLVEVRSTHVWPSPPGSSLWGTITWARTSSNVITVTHVDCERHGRFELLADGSSHSTYVEDFVKVLASAVRYSSWTWIALAS